MQRSIIKLATTISSWGSVPLKSSEEPCRLSFRVFSPRPKKGTFVYQLPSPIRQRLNSAALPVIWIHEYGWAHPQNVPQGGTEMVQGRKQEIHGDKVLWATLGCISACYSKGQGEEVGLENGRRQHLRSLTHMLPVDFSSVSTGKDHTMAHPRTTKEGREQW